jgi:hypothetical protein
MTSLAFTFGTLPLALASGAGAELRQAIGTAVVFGMVGVTALGLFLTPVFYVTIRWITEHFGWAHIRMIPAELRAMPQRARGAADRLKRLKPRGRK